jgi:hypothetical protein
MEYQHPPVTVHASRLLTGVWTIASPRRKRMTTTLRLVSIGRRRRDLPLPGLADSVHRSSSSNVNRGAVNS